MNEELAVAPVVNMTEAVDVPAFYQNASMLQVSPEEQSELLAAFDQNEVEIRPDGLIYLPQAFFRQRLNQAFGVGQWSLIQHRTFHDDNLLYFDGSLLVRGCFVARAMGEAQRHADNKMQSWAGVYESAKSDCIVRCCKDLSLASDLWKPAFADAWVKQHATKVWHEYDKPDKYGKKGKYEWRRNDRPFWWEAKNNGKAAQSNGNAPQSAPNPKPEPTPAPEPKAPQKASDASPDLFVYPFGKYKGHKLCSMPDAAVRSSEEWCRKNGKIEIADACAAYLAMEKPDFINPDDAYSADDIPPFM